MSATAKQSVRSPGWKHNKKLVKKDAIFSFSIIKPADLNIPGSRIKVKSDRIIKSVVKMESIPLVENARFLGLFVFLSLCVIYLALIKDSRWHHFIGTPQGGSIDKEECDAGRLALAKFIHFLKLSKD